MAYRDLPLPKPGPDYGWIWEFPGRVYKTINPKYVGKTTYRIAGRDVSIRQLRAWWRIQNEKVFWKLHPVGEMWYWLPWAHASFLGCCIKEGCSEEETAVLIEIWNEYHEKAKKIWEKATNTPYPAWPYPIPEGIFVDENGQVWDFREHEG
jgi:hypothetical protein